MIQGESEEFLYIPGFVELVSGKYEMDDELADGVIGLARKNGIDPGALFSFAGDILFEQKVTSDIESGHARHIESTAPIPMESIQALGQFRHGHVMGTDEFMHIVKTGCIIDYDGFGEFVSGDGNETLPVIVDMRWLAEFRDDWPYVVWYNR